MSETYVNYKYEPNNGTLYQDAEPDNYGLSTVYQFDEHDKCYYATDGNRYAPEFIVDKVEQGKVRRVMTMPLD